MEEKMMLERFKKERQKLDRKHGLPILSEEEIEEAGPRLRDFMRKRSQQ